MDEVQVYIKERTSTFRFAYQMVVPDLLKKGTRASHKLEGSKPLQGRAGGPFSLSIL
jgi:hypothetical protein